MTNLDNQLFTDNTFKLLQLQSILLPGRVAWISIPGLAHTFEENDSFKHILLLIKSNISKWVGPQVLTTLVTVLPAYNV